MTPADRKIAMEWYEREYPNANKCAARDGKGSRWHNMRECDLQTFAAGLAAGRNWAAGVAWDAITNHAPDGSLHDLQEMINIALLKGPQ